jgi:hypothetical protein
VRRAAAILGLLALAACAHRPHELVPDAPSAIATAIKLCNWQMPPASLRAELNGDRWHVWDDAGMHAYLNRYDTGNPYVCVGL